jgi:hypothetical protein
LPPAQRHVEHERDSNEDTSARAQWELQNERWALMHFSDRLPYGRTCHCQRSLVVDVQASHRLKLTCILATPRIGAEQPRRSAPQPQATTVQFFLIHPSSSSPSLIALIFSSRSSDRRPFSHHSHAFYTPLTDSPPSFRTLENDDQLSPRRRDPLVYLWRSNNAHVGSLPVFVFADAGTHLQSPYSTLRHAQKPRNHSQPTLPL